MAGLTDGLGFEEVNQSGLSTNLVQAVSGVYTRTEATSYLGDANGQVYSSRAQGGFGARIEVGSCTTTSAGFGSAIFNTAFSNTQYFFTAQTGSTSVYDTDEAVSGVITISGANGRGVGSVIFQGAASTPYTWVAIGL